MRFFRFFFLYSNLLFAQQSPRQPVTISDGLSQGDLRSYIRIIFEGVYRIEETYDGQQGIDKAILLIPDVVICDLMMPRLDGFGFCKALKSDIRTTTPPS